MKKKPNMSVVRSGAKVLQMKITLRHAKPPIWRRIQVNNSITLYELHNIVQITMGWTNSHLHAFTANDVYYSIPSEDDWQPVVDERNVYVKDVAGREGAKLEYMYDFGDDWEHTILIEKILPAIKGEQYPVCVAGRRACPPEDVGGVWGYEEFLQAIEDPSHPEHESYMEWAGTGFDPARFDRNEINEMLKDVDKYLSDWADLY